MTLNLALRPENLEVPKLQRISYSYLFGSRARIGWEAAIALVILVFAPLSVSRAKTTMGFLPRSPSVDSLARPCNNTPIGPKASKGTKKKGKKDLGDAGADSAGACVEVRSRALEIQEYLQAYGREQKWNLSDEHVAEDAWTFTRKLDREEFLRYTKNNANTDRINWTSGEAFVQVKTLDLDEGFIRVQVSARFRGYGQNLDQFAPPKESWPLSSNRTLENQLVSALEAHYKSAQ
jgi:hypothetical protein